MRYWVIGTLLAAVVIFVWGAVSHMALEIPGSMKELQDPEAMMAAVQTSAPNNGLYYDVRGLIVVRSFTPDMADKSQAMGGNLILEFLTNLGEALLLAFLLSRITRATMLQRGTFAAAIALAAILAEAVSYWNWYGFPFALVLQDLLDLLVGWFLAGLILGWAYQRQHGSSPAAA